ncbi:S9 family peptidase [Stenotrophomonas sp. 278]|uniref:S9 family peptidase n=1 Tax=Stenotrophomonas sp. 278 TaxID=2479851 RepID=UPI000F673A21|nr:S9 family peptidase [Stenotrophomonas sp. 278]RRU25600.1 S9 family peptidase [Stenotrophomonas sp. 278]
MRTTLLVSAVHLALAGCKPAPESTPSDGSAATPAATAAPAEPELIPRDALFGNPERVSVQLSPDGQFISWIAPVNGVLNVWVAPANDINAAKAVTKDASRGIRNHFWSYRPGTLVYLRDTGGDEDFHAFAVDVNSGAEKDLSPFPKTRAEVVGLSHLKPDAVLVSMNDRDPKWHDLYSVDLGTGKRTEVVKNTHDLSSYVADANYQVRYATRSRDDGGSDILKPDGKGGWSKIDEIPFEDGLTTGPAGMTTDGSTLYLFDSRNRDTSALFAMDTTSGQRTLVAEDARADVSESLSDPSTGKVQAVAVDYLREEWKPLDDGIAADLKKLKEIGPGDISVNSRTLDDKTWIVAYSAAEQPVLYYRYDRADGGKLTKLFGARPALEGKPLVKQWPQEIKARDGLNLVSYLTLPKVADANADGKADKPVPLVLFVHGGPWARDSYGYSGYSQWLANRGYAVLQVNYRGSTGFGKSFTNAGNGEWAGKMHDDLLDAVQWAVDNKVTTKDQVAIFGGSYGGYATLVGLTFTPDTFKCGVDLVGPSNLNTLLSTIPPYWASFYEQFAKRVGDPRTPEGKKLLDERSPLSHVDKINKPLLIGQGANDPRVKQPESDQIVKAMQEKGIPVTYALFPDEGHGFARPENNKAFNAVTEGFLAQCLGGRAEPIGGDFTGSSISVPTGAEGVPGLAEALKGHTANVKK